LLFYAFIYHPVKITNIFFSARNGRQGTLTVDEQSPVQSLSLDGATQLDTDGILWLGGTRGSPSGLPEDFYNSFDGCIDHVYIDGRSLNMAENRLDSHNLQYCT
jgi:coxsackievirus/adenovirus receptor